MVVTQKNVLLKPSKWEDPYEGILSNSQYKGEKFDKLPHYGQCWTKSEESEGLWRSFTNGKYTRCVKIRSSVEHIAKNWASNNNLSNNFLFFIDDVHYVEDKDNKYQEELCNRYKHLQDEIKKRHHDINPKDLFALTLLLTKRKAFEHEKEVRVIFIDKDGKDDSIYAYKINPVVMIEEIELDPWTPKNELDSFKQLFEELGFNRDIVKRSELFDKDKDGIPFYNAELETIEILKLTDISGKASNEEP